MVIGSLLLLKELMEMLKQQWKRTEAGFGIMANWSGLVVVWLG
jgi:hypothetical protein